MIEDTICAISTAPGKGGIALARISGPSALEISERVFHPFREPSGASQSDAAASAEPSSLSSQSPQKGFSPEGFSKLNPTGTGADLAGQKARFPIGRAIYGKIGLDEIFDEGILTAFKAPHSYTGEDTVEISCHGSTYIQQKLIQTLIEAGCRLAKAGEFTKRAFLNGKMDLSQAEAVADLIASESYASNKLALKQLRGGYSQELDLLRERLLKMVSLLELELDFSEEDVTFASREELNQLTESIETRIDSLCRSFRLGNVVKNGIPVAIVGETNAGKSTLLNLLLREDKAIVSDIHGTTRDSIEDCINLQGITFRFIDTAGLRETEDKIERLGIERTYQKVDQAAIVIWMIDSTQVSDRIDLTAHQLLPHIDDKPLLIVFNKSDKTTEAERSVIDSLFAHLPGEHLHISAKNGFNTDLLQEKLVQLAGIDSQTLGNDLIVTNLRHYEALSAALTAIRRVRTALSANLPGDLIAQDLREVLSHLGTITGHITTDEILGNIFKNFCIGK